MTEEGLKRLADEVLSGRGILKMQLAQVAEEHSQLTGVHCQSWFVGGQVGAFLVPVRRRENEE